MRPRQGPVAELRGGGGGRTRPAPGRASAAPGGARRGLGRLRRRGGGQGAGRAGRRRRRASGRGKEGRKNEGKDGASDAALGRRSCGRARACRRAARMDHHQPVSRYQVVSAAAPPRPRSPPPPLGHGAAGAPFPRLSAPGRGALAGTGVKHGPSHGAALTAGPCPGGGGCPPRPPAAPASEGAAARPAREAAFARLPLPSRGSRGSRGGRSRPGSAGFPRRLPLPGAGGGSRGSAAGEEGAAVLVSAEYVPRSQPPKPWDF